MAKMKSLLTRAAPRLLSIMRIIIGFTFMAHGAQKLLGFPKPMPSGTVALFSFIGFAGVLELVGGGLLLLGLFTRPVAFILSGMMAVAYFTVHARNGFYPIVNGGELAVVYCFAFFYLSAAGGGPWSVDAVARRVS